MGNMVSLPSQIIISHEQDGSAFGTDRKLPTQPNCTTREVSISSWGVEKVVSHKTYQRVWFRGEFSSHFAERTLWRQTGHANAPALPTVTIFRLHFFESIIMMMVIVFPQNRCQVLCKDASDEGNFPILFIFEWATSISWQESFFIDQFWTLNKIYSSDSNIPPSDMLIPANCSN